MPANGIEITLPTSWWPIATTMTSCGVFGNSLIIAVTLVKRYVRSASDILICILALSDLISCLGMYMMK